ncbi:hypothetical protein L249_2936 [Ophiocordyceps polyrhachis-furcata BCC 54312]|uniref:PAN-3 domain-containing protein n=1 Tax=Ophiocordyceps polyrhachis-furcata BCC 54312 TaxID=1330021 RepID=A0A367LSR6_9HYPO|nr:hypothetical protein L249_2936 [Ophiocordyceps polyrhachis-furcata BCC 54312]
MCIRIAALDKKWRTMIASCSLGFALPLLATLTGASAEEWFDLCPGKDGLSETTGYGREVTYHCGQRFPQEHLLETVTTSDADSCVSSCVGSTDCVGSQWTSGHNECQLFSEGADSLEASTTEQGNVIALVLSPETLLTVTKLDEQQTVMGVHDSYSGQDGGSSAETSDSRSCRSCKKLLTECESSEEKLEADVRTCKKGTEAVEEKLKKCNESNKKAESDKKALQKEISGLKHKMHLCPKPLNQKQVCPTYKGSLLRQGGATWRVSCQQGPYGGVLRTTGGSFEGCAEACAKDGKCKAINYWSNRKAPCTMISQIKGMGSVVRDPLGKYSKMCVRKHYGSKTTMIPPCLMQWTVGEPRADQRPSRGEDTWGCKPPRLIVVLYAHIDGWTRGRIRSVEVSHTSALGFFFSRRLNTRLWFPFHRGDDDASRRFPSRRRCGGNDPLCYPDGYHGSVHDRHPLRAGREGILSDEGMDRVFVCVCVCTETEKETENVVTDVAETSVAPVNTADYPSIRWSKEAVPYPVSASVASPVSASIAGPVSASIAGPATAPPNGTVPSYTRLITASTTGSTAVAPPALSYAICVPARSSWSVFTAAFVFTLSEFKYIKYWKRDKGEKRSPSKHCSPSSCRV